MAEHWKVERKRLLERIAALEGGKASEAGALTVPPAVSDAVDPVSPAEFFMHLVVGISSHQGMTAFDPNAQGGLLANGALAYDTYTRLCRDHTEVLAKARENMAIRAKHDAEIEADIEAKREARRQHREGLLNAKGPAQVNRLMDRGHSMKEAAVLAALQKNGLTVPLPDAD